MRRAVRQLLAALGVCVLAPACSGLNGLSGDQNNEGAEYLRRWKVTDASGKMLSSGCTKQADPYSPANVITIHAPAGDVVTYQDNLGIEYVDKSRGAQQLPTSDAYWCSTQDIVQTILYSPTGLEKVEVADPDPPAAIEKIDLVNPSKDSQGQVVADGIRLKLRILHPGVLHLGFLGPADLDAGADAGPDGGTQLYNVYPAMTIQ